jgi:hypothetical protein
MLLNSEEDGVGGRLALAGRVISFLLEQASSCVGASAGEWKDRTGTISANVNASAYSTS